MEEGKNLKQTKHHHPGRPEQMDEGQPTEESETRQELCSQEVHSEEIQRGWGTVERKSKSDQTHEY